MKVDLAGRFALSRLSSRGSPLYPVSLIRLPGKRKSKEV